MTAEALATEPLLSLREIKKRVGETVILDGVDLTVAGGEVVVIVGPSGAGKSTLLRMANLLERPNSGTVVFDGVELTDIRCDLNRARRQMGIVFQAYNLFPHRTALANVALPLRMVLGMSKEDARARACTELERVGLGEKADRHPSRLSGGEQQRVAIARALALRPKLMLFDEVTAALDPELVHEVLRVMRGLAREGMTMVVVTHEIGFGAEIADRMVVMDSGRIIEQGHPAQVMGSPATARARLFFRHLVDETNGAPDAATTTTLVASREPRITGQGLAGAQPGASDRAEP